MGWDPTSAACGVPDFGSKKGAPLFLGLPSWALQPARSRFGKGSLRDPPPLAILAQLHLIQGDLRVAFYLILSLGLHFILLYLYLIGFQNRGWENL